MHDPSATETLETLATKPPVSLNRMSNIFSRSKSKRLGTRASSRTSELALQPDLENSGHKNTSPRQGSSADILQAGSNKLSGAGELAGRWRVFFYPPNLVSCALCKQVGQAQMLSLYSCFCMLLTPSHVLNPHLILHALCMFISCITRLGPPTPRSVLCWL